MTNTTTTQEGSFYFNPPNFHTETNSLIFPIPEGNEKEESEQIESESEREVEKQQVDQEI